MGELRAILAVTGLLAVFTGAWWLDHAGYKRGVTVTEARYQAEQAEVLREANARIEHLQNVARAAEQAAAARLADISSTFQKRLANAQVENDQMRAALVSGVVRLRLPSPQDASSPDGGRGTRAQAPAASSGCDGAKGGELPREVAVALWTIAADADGVAEQLHACQQVIRADRNPGS